MFCPDHPSTSESKLKVLSRTELAEELVEEKD